MKPNRILLLILFLLEPENAFAQLKSFSEKPGITDVNWSDTATYAIGDEGTMAVKFETPSEYALYTERDEQNPVFSWIYSFDRKSRFFFSRKKEIINLYKDSNDKNINCSATLYYPAGGKMISMKVPGKRWIKKNYKDSVSYSLNLNEYPVPFILECNFHSDEYLHYKIGSEAGRVWNFNMNSLPTKLSKINFIIPDHFYITTSSKGPEWHRVNHENSSRSESVLITTWRKVGNTKNPETNNVFYTQSIRSFTLQNEKGERTQSSVSLSIKQVTKFNIIK